MEPDDCAESAPVAVTCHDNAVFLRERLGGQVVVVECTAVCVAATQPESQSLLSR